MLMSHSQLIPWRLGMRLAIVANSSLSHSTCMTLFQGYYPTSKQLSKVNRKYHPHRIFTFIACALKWYCARTWCAFQRMLNCMHGFFQLPFSTTRSTNTLLFPQISLQIKFNFCWPVPVHCIVESQIRSHHIQSQIDSNKLCSYSLNCMFADPHTQSRFYCLRCILQGHAWESESIWG